MSRRKALEAFIAWKPLPEDPNLSEEVDALYVDQWFPAAVRLTPQVYLVRVYNDGPLPEITGEFAEVLTEAGLSKQGENWPIIESITLQRLGVLLGQWQVWGDTLENAQTQVDKAAHDLDSHDRPESYDLQSPETLGEALITNLHEVALAVQEKFGDREPSDKEARAFMIDRLIEQGKTPEEAEALLAD